MYLPSKIIGLLVFVTNTQLSLQKSYRPIIDGLKLKSPYYIVGNVDFQQRNLIKYHSMNSEFSMICKKANDIPMVNKDQIQSIIQFAFPIPKGSPFKIFLEQAINDNIESGTLERIKKYGQRPNVIVLPYW